MTFEKLKPFHLKHVEVLSITDKVYKGLGLLEEEYDEEDNEVIMYKIRMEKCAVGLFLDEVKEIKLI